MKETIYIFSNGELKRKDNTLFFESEQGKKFIPIEQTKEILVFGEVDFNKKALEFLSQKEIILSYFNYYGYYMGSFYPREHYNSGYLLIKQVEYYNDVEKRLFLAKQFIAGAVKNTLKILKYYNRREKELESQITEIETLLQELESQDQIDKAMSVEGRVKKIYYSAINEILDNEDFRFEKRSKRPPKDYINAMISFTNSMIYNFILSEIYKTHLDPRIGFLHTSNFRRFSLNLDVAEIFKPIIGDRTIFSAINKGIVTAKDFDDQLNGIIFTDSGKKKYIEHLEERLKATIKHHKLKREVSYRRLMRLELYKLEKHLLGEEEYQPFVMDW